MWTVKRKNIYILKKKNETIEKRFLREGTTENGKKTKNLLMGYISIRDLRSDLIIIKIVVKVVKSGSKVGVFVPALEHETVQFVGASGRTGHTVACLDSFDDLPVVHSCKKKTELHL